MADKDKRTTRATAKKQDGQQSQENSRVTRSASAAAAAAAADADKAADDRAGASKSTNGKSSTGASKKRKNDGEVQSTKEDNKKRKLPKNDALDPIAEEDEYDTNDAGAAPLPDGSVGEQHAGGPAGGSADEPPEEKDEATLEAEWRQGWDDLFKLLESSPEGTKKSAQALRERAEQAYAFNKLKICVLDLSRPLNRQYFEDLRRAVVKGELERFDDVWKDSPDFDEAAYAKARDLADEGHDPIWPTPRKVVPPVEPIADVPLRWKASWQALNAELVSVASAEVFRHIAKDFDTLFERANSLRCKDQAFAMEPPEWIVGQSPADYVEKTLRQAVMDKERSYFDPLWEEAMDKERIAGNKVKARELKQRHAKMRSKLLKGDRPYLPALEDCLSNWMALRAHANFSTGRTPARMQAFSQLLANVNSLDRYNIYISPPPWPLELSWEEYVPILTDTVLAERKRHYILAWDKERFPDGRDHDVDEVFNERFRALQEHVMKGGGPYMPRETVPAAPVAAVEAPESKQQTAIDLGFGTPEGLPGRWSFKDTLGEGTYGHAGIWVQYSDHGTIITRVVLKDSYLTEGWDNVRFRRDMGSAHYEVIVSRALAGLPSNENVVRYIADATYARLKMYRIYMEYCEHGTLESLLKEYQLFSRSKPVTSTGKRIQTLVPVRVMWAILENLTSALCLLHSGYLPNDAKNKPQNWTQYMHFDVKPVNVMLSKPRTSCWADIPTVKLGDFGIAYPVDAQQSGKILGGTAEYQAPEQVQYGLPGAPIDNILNRNNPTTPKCDIYSLGRMMVTLMNQALPPSVTFITTERENRLSDAADAFYPEAMKIIVKRCTSLGPGDRPTSAEVYGFVRKEVERFPGPNELPLRLQGRVEGEAILFLPDRYLLWAPEG